MQDLEFTYQLDEIDAIAKQVIKHLASKTILFYGEMGSGKTTFINALLKALHSKDEATSPTFSIVNEYNLPDEKVYHFDFYRINSIEEALDFGVEDYLMSDHWLFIEWPNKINSLLPKDSCNIEISTINPHKRTLKLTKNITYVNQ